MKRMLCSGILAASVLAAYTLWRGNQQVYAYSLNVVSYTNIPVNAEVSKFECGRSLGTYPFYIGYAVNSRGRFSDNIWTRHTSMYAGPFNLNVSGDLSRFLDKGRWLAAALGMGAIFWLVTTPPRSKTDPDQERPDDDPKRIPQTGP